MGPNTAAALYMHVQQNQANLPFTREHAHHAVTYGTSWLQFYSLVITVRTIISPTMVKEILKVKDPAVAKERFEQWSVVKLGIYFAIKCLCVTIGFLTTPGFAILHLPTATIGFAFAVFFIHLNWFCIVKRDGCCGHHGYLAWAVYLALEPLLLWGLFAQYYGGWLKLFLYVPNFFMFAACLALFRAPPATRVESAVNQAKEALNNFKTTGKAVVQPLCQGLCPCLDPPVQEQGNVRMGPGGPIL